MTTINFPDPDFPDSEYLYNLVKSKGWENMSKVEKHIVRKACKSHMELAQLMTLKPDRREWRL